jgi:hypothetical protein
MTISKKWRTTSTENHKMEDNLKKNGSEPKKKLKLEDDLKKKWKTTKKKNGRGPNFFFFK